MGRLCPYKVLCLWESDCIIGTQVTSILWAKIQYQKKSMLTKDFEIAVFKFY